MNKYLILSLILLAATVTTTAATVQHHPFSQLFPPNEDLDLGGKDVENASEVETEVIRANDSDIFIRNSGNIDIARLRQGGNVEIPNGNLEVGLNTADRNLTVGYNSNNKVKAGFESGNPFIEASDGQDDDFEIRTAPANGGGDITLEPDNAVALRATQPNQNVEIPNGNLNMNGNRIRNVPAPSSPGDAVNKSYVDSMDDTVSDDQNLQDVLSQGEKTGGFDINLTSESKLVSDEGLNVGGCGGDNCIGHSGFDLHLQHNYAGNVVLAGGGGKVLSQGNLDMSGNDIKNPGNTPVYLINEDFDDGSASGWTIDTAACGSSGITSNPSVSGDSPAIDPEPVNTNVLQATGDDIHLSPTIDATTYSSLTLKTYISSASMDDSTEDTVIQIYNGTSWVTVANSHNHPETGKYPKFFETDVSPYINSNFQLRFRNVGNNGCGDYGTIDEVRVVGSP